MYCIRIYKAIYSIMYVIVWYIQFLIQHPHICIDSLINMFLALCIFGFNPWLSPISPPFPGHLFIPRRFASHHKSPSFEKKHLWPGAVVAREPFFSVFWVFCLSPLPLVSPWFHGTNKSSVLCCEKRTLRIGSLSKKQVVLQLGDSRFHEIGIFLSMPSFRTPTNTMTLSLKTIWQVTWDPPSFCLDFWKTL